NYANFTVHLFFLLISSLEILKNHVFLVFAKDSAKNTADLALCCIVAYRIEDKGHKVVFTLSSLKYCLKAVLDFNVVTVFLHGAEFLYLVDSYACIDFKEFALRHVFFDLELVDADDDPVSGLDGFL